MADILVYLVLNNVDQLLKDDQESVLRDEIGAQMKLLGNGLRQMNEFLCNSKGKREAVEYLVNRIAKVAEKADDVVETFVVNVAKHKRRNTLDKYLRDPKHTTMLSEVLMEIKSIEGEISKIYREKKYGIQMEAAAIEGAGKDGKDQFANRVLWKNFVSDSLLEHFGLDDKINQVREQLITEKKDGPCEVFSFTGLIGAGKTTLAKAIFNDTIVKDRFKCRAWASASVGSLKELLLSILQSINPSAKETHKDTNEENLEKDLKSFLEGKRYLIILEKVYDSKFFDRIRSALPDNSNNSRILITTHKREVANAALSSYIHNVTKFYEESSWRLFCKMAFHDEDACPRELVEIGKKIVGKCEGIPFAIMLIGIHMSKVENSGKAWCEICDQIEPVEKGYRDVMRFIYKLIPQPLKPCLLYFALFPKDYEINVRKLVKMWIAEGFVKNSTSDHGRRELEEIAEDYLEELVKCTLIKVVMRSDGGLKSCTMSGFFQDYCLSVQENFGISILEETTDDVSRSTLLRRLSIFCNPSKYISSPPWKSNIRSLLCFHNQDMLYLEKMENFQSLRVLDFGDTVIHKVPADIKEFVHLRYLRINAPHMREIPASISNLPVLETLDLRESSIVYFRQNFWKMQQLKHLFILGDCDLPSDCKDVRIMSNLEILSTISPQILNWFDFKTVFPKVRKLGLHSSRYIVGTRLPNLVNVQTLKIINPFYFRFHPNAFSPTLTKVTLLRTEISSSVFATLGHISNLRALKLMKKSVADWHIHCKEGSFPQLQLLHMSELDVTRWTQQSGAMKMLEYLVIKDCVELTDIPKHFAPTLRNVKVSGCTSRLLKTLRSTLGNNICCDFQELVEPDSAAVGGSVQSGYTPFFFSNV